MPRRDDEGFAMIVSVVIATVALMLVTAILAMGVHVDSATVRERRWELAFQIAESGVEESITQLRDDLSYGGTGAGTPKTIPGGEFETVLTPLANGGVQVDSIGYQPSATAANRIARRIRAVYEPEPTFKYALFSESSLFVSSGSGVINGDVFANEDVEIDNTTVVVGDVVSRWGKVSLGNNAKVLVDPVEGGGSVTTGGFDPTGRWAVNLSSNGSKIAGDVHIRVETVCNITPGGTPAYSLRNGGVVAGTVYMPAGASVLDPAAVTREDKCVQRDGKESLPAFTFDPSNYPGLQFHDAAWFNSGGAISGNHYITGGGVIDLSKRTVTGSLVLISEPKIRHSNTGGFFPSGMPNTAVVQIIALDPSEDPANPSFEVENQFDVPVNTALDPPGPAVLVYSAGYCDFKNSTLDNGAVYCKGMNIKNGLEISYDERIKQLLGFGSARLLRSSFVELPPSTPLP